MRKIKLLLLALPLAAGLGGCGVGVTSLPEVWDRAADSDAAYHMEVQVKHAIWCELREAVVAARLLESPRRLYGAARRDITSEEDILLPDSWGALVQLSLQADEKSALTPGIVLRDPIDSARTGFRLGPPTIAQSFQVGVGAQLSSQNIREDKYNFFWAVRDLRQPINPVNNSCYTKPTIVLGDRPTTSSPFVDASNLGIREWLRSAVRVIAYHRSSRSADDDSGPPLGSQSGATASDSTTFRNRFIILSSASVSPTWNLIRIGTPTTPLFDVNRTRTHELIITLGPGALERSKTPAGRLIVSVVPSNTAIASHLASQIGSAVANALPR